MNASKPPFDFKAIDANVLLELESQGIKPSDIVQLAEQYGEPVPPIVQEALSKDKVPNLKKYPATVPIGEYNQFKKDEKLVQKNKPLKRAATFGYMFSDLLREDIVREMKRTQGSFLVGVNLTNLFNEFRKMVVDNNNNNTKKESPAEKSESIFKKIGEYLDVNYDDILEKKMGYRDGSNISRLPEIHLDRTSTFDQIIDESKLFADAGYKGEITPVGLLMMTRMLYKYKKNTAQWVRVATVLELIYKYLGGGQTRQHFFKDKHEISILSLMDLEEFYNTDHIFMTTNEIELFKKNLEFYKEDLKDTIALKLNSAKLKT